MAINTLARVLMLVPSIGKELFAIMKFRNKGGGVRQLPTNPLDLDNIFDFDAYSKILERCL